MDIRFMKTEERIQGILLKKAIEKYGTESFKKEVLQEFNNKNNKWSAINFKQIKNKKTKL